MKLLPIYLIISMFVTMFILYIMYPEPTLMVKHPTLDIQCDSNNVCYKRKNKDNNPKPESDQVNH